MLKNNQNTDFQNHSLFNISHITINSEPAETFHVTASSYVEILSENDRNRLDLSLLMNDQTSFFKKDKLTKLDSISLNRISLVDEEAVNERYVDDTPEEESVLRFNATFGRC